ncbi:MAG: DUF305 domain-containing protein [Hyphomicrobiales bacterium]|nr:DUF305 domain-containing protein [Hyphomicrobiales bacterium]
MARTLLILSVVTTIALAAIGVAHSDQLSPGSKALEEANSAMHQSMTMEMTGNVDADFMRSMIPHHQGAIDMARIVMEYGKDPEVRTLAEAIVSAQETEIAFMKAWLEKNGVPEGGMEMDHSQH